jgi:hypothetical protein
MSSHHPQTNPNSLANLAKGGYVAGQSGNPAGRKKGSINMAPRIRKILNGDIDWHKISINDPGLAKLKKRYGHVTVAEALIWVQASKALAGDTTAFNALREGGWGRMIKFDGEAKLEVVHILKPEKLALAQIESEAERLRQRALDSIQEAEVVDELDSPSGSAELRAFDP